MYPNSFDMLTTHGIITEDLVGYVTDTPSPYLQNYVAQRGWNPTLPGQVLPDPLPNVQPKRQVVSDVYQPVKPYRPVIEPQKKDKWGTFKKVVAAGLLIGLGGLGIYKGRKVIGDWWTKISTPSTSGKKDYWKNFCDWVKKPFQKTPGADPWYKKAWDWVCKPFKKTTTP